MEGDLENAVALRRVRPPTMAVGVGFALLAMLVAGRAISTGLVATRAHGIEPAVAKLPISFEPNAGRTAARVDFLSHSVAGGTLYLTSGDAVLSLPEGRDESRALRLGLVGADPSAEAAGLEQLPGTANSLVGDDPSKWRTGIPTYGRVRYKKIYPGVDLDFYGDQGHLEYDFNLAPEADPSQIAVDLQGAASVRLAPDGDLLLRVGERRIRQRAPVAYQQFAGQRHPVAVSYVLHGDTVGFRLGAYERSRPLVIDPLVLAYSTYLAGNGQDNGEAIAVDASGAAYVVGSTASTDYCTGAGCSIDANENSTDAFISKLSPSGSALTYTTYLGGNGVDEGHGIAVDSSGSAYVTGFTGSSDFNTVNPIAGEGDSGDTDVFVSKLTPAGSALTYSTYLGGGASDVGNAIAVDSSGSAYVTGNTQSTDFDTVGAIDTDSTGTDAFASKLAFDSGTNTLSLGYSTYLSGDAFDNGHAIAVEPGAAAYVTGRTDSSDYCTGAGCSFQAFTPGSSNNPFVTKLNSNGSLGYSTYLAGSDPDEGNGIAVDSSGSAYVTGYTASLDFPTVNPIEGNPVSTANDDDAFISKLNSAGTALVYSTYLGGSTDGNPDPTDGDDQGNAIAVDSSGAVYVTGRTESIDFPTVDPIEGNSGAAGDFDAFISKINPAGNALTYSTYLGGTGDDQGTGIAVDSSGAAYMTGFTSSTDFDTVGPIEGDPGDTAEDAFVSKLAVVSEPQPPAPSPEVPPVSKAQRTLTLDANKSKVKRGKKVRLSGQLDAAQNEAACETGQTIELQRRKSSQSDSQFASFASVQTDSAGSFAEKLKVKRTFVYRAKVGENEACDDAVSNSEKVRAKKTK